jgi:hypothetical protein
MKINLRFKWFRKHQEHQTCARCMGKGYVDLDDICRLNMSKHWKQGYCKYCDATGRVELGKPKYVNPLRTDIGPSIHPTDFPLPKPSKN